MFENSVSCFSPLLCDDPEDVSLEVITFGQLNSILPKVLAQQIGRHAKRRLGNTRSFQSPLRYYDFQFRMLLNRLYSVLFKLTKTLKTCEDPNRENIIALRCLRGMLGSANYVKRRGNVCGTDLGNIFTRWQFDRAVLVP